jgi:hypothetical protein
MNLQEIAIDIRQILDEKRKKLDLTFFEDEHIYYMRDLDGVIKSNFPSVSKVYKKFYKEFDSVGKSLQMAKGDKDVQQQLLQEWKKAGDLSTNMGSRVHYELEKELIKRYGDYKEVRQPIFEINQEQKRKSDAMIIAGKKFLDLMIERGAVLLDTEIVLGDPELGYVGQPDKCWIINNKEKTNIGLVITDWKTNKPSNFEVKPYTDNLYEPFKEYPNTALSHYYLQLPLYGKLILKMLQDSKYGDLKLLGNVVVLLKDDNTFQEFKVPSFFNDTILNSQKIF